VSRRSGFGALLALGLLIPAARASAQAPGTAGGPTPALVHYGKWGAAALFATFTALGVVEHNRANARFEDLRRFCFDVGPCTIGADGRYADAQAEARYQAVVSGDRAARTWLISGQVALAGAAALFVVELLKEKGTQNIPSSGLEITPTPTGTRIGLRLPFRGP